MHIDTFSGAAADLKPRHRTGEDILAALSRDPRVSTWDMGEHLWLRNGIGNLVRNGLIVKLEEPYPWLRYALTDSGRALLTPPPPTD